MMKTLTFFLILLSIAACTEPEPIELVPDPVEYQVRLEVECDSCEVFMRFNGVDLLVEDSIYGNFLLDTILFSGDTASIGGMCQFGESDSINARIYINDSIVTDSTTYKSSPEDEFVMTFVDYIFE